MGFRSVICRDRAARCSDETVRVALAVSTAARLHSGEQYALPAFLQYARCCNFKVNTAPQPVQGTVTGGFLAPISKNS